MKNKLIKLFPKNKDGVIKAILETPCYPNPFYYGPVLFDDISQTKEWITLNNSTSNWYKSIEDIHPTE
jgi:hypothetical protein